jgi:hypothetical protein
MVKLEVDLLKYDTVKDSGRIYTKEIVLQMIEKFKKTPERFFGEYNHPTTNIVNLINISHRITEMQLNEDTKTLEGTIEILDTPKGTQLLEELSKSENVLFDIHPRGMGCVNKETNEIYNYNLITFDIVPKK